MTIKCGMLQFVHKPVGFLDWAKFSGLDFCRCSGFVDYHARFMRRLDYFSPPNSEKSPIISSLTPD